MTAGHGIGTPACPDCWTFMQAWRGRWRCPWVTSSDPAPDIGDWSCQRPYQRTGLHMTDQSGTRDPLEDRCVHTWHDRIAGHSHCRSCGWYLTPYQDARNGRSVAVASCPYPACPMYVEARVA